MARTRILLDSNAYFRLARSIHPLLDTEFGGKTQYCLYVIPELSEEFEKSARLRRKFSWVDDAEYTENRSRALILSKAERKDIDGVFDFMANHARIEGLGTSPTDVRALATAYVLKIRIVTDDHDMLVLAKAFGVSALKTLELMHLMLKAGHIDMDRVRQIAEYWQFEKDTPRGFRRDYARLFAG